MNLTRTDDMQEISSMHISIQDITTALDDLVSEGRAREEIASWANMVLSKSDLGELTIDNCKSPDIIWRALNYLSGADLKDDPDTYTHSIENFIVFRKSIGV